MRTIGEVAVELLPIFFPSAVTGFAVPLDVEVEKLAESDLRSGGTPRIRGVLSRRNGQLCARLQSSELAQPTDRENGRSAFSRSS